MRRMFSRAFVVAAFVTGCASAEVAENQVAIIDAAMNPPPVDARNNNNPPVDSHQVTTPDAPSGCTTMTMQLLTNGNFDTNPLGTGWTETPADPMYPPISKGSDMPTGYSADTNPNVAWMGGIATSGATDAIYQDVQVPAGTMTLELTGSYMVLTTQTATTAKDKATVSLHTPAGATIESAMALDNTGATADWTPLDHTFTTATAGMTVRLFITSTHGTSTTDVTDFFFDSLQLVATQCN